MADMSALIACARSYIGVRFAHQGRSRQAGVDCLGLLLCAAQDVGITLRQREVYAYDRTDYGTYPDTQMLRMALESTLIRVNEIAIGDVLLLRIDGRPQHLALVSDYPEAEAFGMIHSYAPLRKVVEHRLDETWQAAIERIYRIPESPSPSFD